MVARHCLVGGTLIDGTGAAPRPLHWLAMEGGRIVHIEAGEGPGAPLPPDAEVVENAAGKTVMPGLVDAHCHISYGVARGIEEQDLFASAEYRAIRGVYHARTVLQSGVTSFSDPGGSWFVAVAVRNAIKAGLFPGPRISAAARYLSTHAALTDYFPSWVGTPRSGVGALTEGES
ncbi:MAG: amidohydrolase family protein, partial [Blastomonas fulva]